MYFATVFGTLIMPLIGLQVQQAFGCTFMPYQEEFAASVKYEILKSNERECLQVCYEEPDCTFVQFVQLITDVCTIYKNGSETQNLTGVVYSIDRQVITPNCPQPLPVAPKVEFPRSFMEVTVDGNEDEPDRLLDQNVTAIYGFQHAGRWFFSPNASLFPDGTKPVNKLLFSRLPQPGCSSLPVFTAASGRIYFGKVYNVTGYTFMHAYAFADICRSKACAGTCCGTMSVVPRIDGSLLFSISAKAIYMVDIIKLETGLSYDQYKLPC